MFGEAEAAVVVRIQRSMVIWRFLGRASDSWYGAACGLRRAVAGLGWATVVVAAGGILLGAAERCRLAGGASCGEEGRCLRVASEGDAKRARSVEDEAAVAKGTVGLEELGVPRGRMSCSK